MHRSESDDYRRPEYSTETTRRVLKEPSALKSRRPGGKSGPVETRKVHAEILAIAIGIAGGDMSKIKINSHNEVVVKEK